MVILQLLELRLLQEQGSDCYEVESSIIAIWHNARILWKINPNDDAAGGELSARWSNILQWNKSTHKKQVKSDAKLVLATRLCLEEQGHNPPRDVKVKNSVSGAGFVRPQDVFEHLDSLELWCFAFLSEYYGSRHIFHDYLLPHLHKLLCPLECSAGYSAAALPYPLNDRSIFSKNDSVDISKNLRVYIHNSYVLHQSHARISHNDPTRAISEDHQQLTIKSTLSPSRVRDLTSFFDDDDDSNARNLSGGKENGHHQSVHHCWSNSFSVANKNITSNRESSKQLMQSQANTIVSKNKEYLRFRKSDKTLNVSNGDKENPIDVSVLNSTISTIVDARSPPRRPHPYPKRLHTIDDVSSANLRHKRSPGRGNGKIDSASYSNSPPINDNRLSLSQLEATSPDADHALQNQYEDTLKNQKISSPNEMGEKGKKKVSPNQLYDRNGRRIRRSSHLSASLNFHEKSRDNTDIRRRSFSMGESSKTDANSHGVAFGRRLTQSHRPLPKKENRQSGTDSIIVTDPQYA